MVAWLVVCWLLLCLPVAVLMGKAIARGTAAAPHAPAVLSSVPEPVAAAVDAELPVQRTSDETTVLAG